MFTKEYLQRAYFLDREIQISIDKIERMRAAVYGARAQTYKNNGGRGNNYGSFEDAVQKVIDYEKRIDAKVDALVEKRLEIENVINAVKDDNEREILTRRYLLYQKWDEIAEALSYDVRHAHKIHVRALGKIRISESVI